MRRNSKILAGIVLGIGLSVQAQASDLCGTNADKIREVYKCDKGTSWTNGACFEIALACGEYESILANQAARVGTSMNEEYWKGMAYYGLMNRTRSTGFRCEYFLQARRSVVRYLKDALTSMSGNDISGKIGTPNPDQVYRATKVNDELNKVDGCLDDNLTKKEIESLAEQLANKSIEDAFIRASSDQSKLMTPMYEEIQKLIKTASTIETSLGLKSVAADSVENYLSGQILEDWSSIGITSGTGLSFQADTSKAESKRDSIARPLMDQAQIIGNALQQAIKGCDRNAFPRQTAQQFHKLTDEQWIALSKEQKEAKAKEGAPFPVVTAQQYFGISDEDWNKMTADGRQDRENEKASMMCSSQASDRFARAADFQRRHATLSSDLGTGHRSLLKDDSERMTASLVFFKANTKVDGVKSIKQSVDDITKSWLKFGNDNAGRFSTRCEEAEYENSWFCLSK